MKQTRHHGKTADRPDPDRAKVLAIAALTFIAGEPERLSRFLDLTGLDPSSIRAAADEPRFAAGILDYLAADEPLLVAFLAESGLAPGAIEKARLALSGQDWERDVP